MAAIPDFVSGAMEHWGLVTYRETALLYTNTTHSSANKQRVATVVAHELAHSWFGNLGNRFQRSKRALTLNFSHNELVERSLAKRRLRFLHRVQRCGLLRTRLANGWWSKQKSATFYPAAFSWTSFWWRNCIPFSSWTQSCPPIR